MIDRPNRAKHKAVRLSVGRQAFIKSGLSRFDPHDPYYFAVSLTWPRFVLLFVAAELGINTVFALLYLLQPGTISGTPWPGFWSAFFFSLETLATVGYGEMFPATFYGHVVASCEIITGVAFSALMAGLLFVRFSRPRAKLLYATHAVVTPNDGTPTLMLRIGNGRVNLLHNVQLTLHALVRTVTTEGRTQGNMVELSLVRNRVPLFAILYTIMHEIDETSPLHGLDADSASVAGLRLFVTIRGQDPVTGQEVTDLHLMEGAAICFGMRYVDAITAGEDGLTVVADYAKLSAIEPDGFGPASSA